VLTLSACASAMSRLAWGARLALVVGDLPAAGADLVGQLLLRVAGGLAELHKARKSQ